MDQFGKLKRVTILLLTLGAMALFLAPLWNKVAGDLAIGNYYRRCVMHNADACETWPPPKGFGPPRYGPGRVPLEVADTWTER